jgi:GntR family transcriptional regulator/MocR family aminotransferase
MVGRRPGREELERALRDGVRAGRLRPGTLLPSSRALAAQLGVSRGVVVEAYAQLVAEGWLAARQGAGTTVAAPAAGPGTRPRGSGLSPPGPEPEPGTGPAGPPAVRYDLRTGRPDLSAFPRRAWARALAAAVRGVPDAALDYGDPRGAPALRAALAGHLGRARAVVADPGRVVVCSGTAGGLGLVWPALREQGVRRVGVEDPGWREQAASVRRAGLEAVPVPVDALGLDVAALAPAGVDAVVVTPAHQFPTGVVLAAERRVALLAWARRTGGVIVEDDYDAEFRYDREPVGALQGLAPDHVVYAGSASKTLAPALRLGWLVLPSRLDEPVAARAARGTAVFDQLALAELIQRGDLDRHLRRMRRSYRGRRDTLVAALGSRATVTGVAAGLHLVAQTGDAAALAARARARGIAVQTLHEDCTTSRPQPPALLLGYARESEPALRRAAGLLLA